MLTQKYQSILLWSLLRIYITSIEVCLTLSTPVKCRCDNSMKYIHSEIGKRIRQYRKRSGMSQERLALNAGITVSFLGDIERNKKKPSIASLEKLLTALNISFLEFFDYENVIKPLENCSALEKLNIALKDKPNDEIEMVYDIVKQILDYNEIQFSNRTP